MKVIYKDNPDLPAGNGFLELSGETFSAGPWRLSIQRSSDQKFLGGKTAGQWLSETTQIPVSRLEEENGDLVIPLSSAFVDSLDQKNQYKVVLTDAAGTEWSGRLKISSITHSMGDSTGNTARFQEKPAKPKPGGQAPQKPLPAPSTPESNLKKDEPLTIEQPEKTAKPVGRRSRWVLPVLALLALFCIAWWYFTPKEESAPPTKKTEAAQKPATRNSAQDVERAVREFFAGSNLAPVNALALARSLPANTPAEKDAIYRLYYYAATSTNPSGLLEYGNCVDPSTPAWGSIEKNGVEAWQIYEKAREDNPQKAEAALARLKEWLEKQASGGNAQARAWLGSINK